MFLYLKLIYLKTCPVDTREGFSLTKYYKPDCSFCDKISPYLDEIDDRIDNLKYNQVNCNECDCSELSIKGVPTLILRKDGKEIDRLRGYNDFNKIVSFVSQIGIDPNIFTNKKTKSGEVQVLYERDFYTGFSGPWIILFYSTKKEPLRDLIKEIAKKYENKISVGEISKKSSINIIHRFNISVYPTILALNDGILAGYNGKPDLYNFSEFIEKLIAPSFKEIDLNEFESMTKDSLEPIFLVFANNLMLANSYFKNLAHDYKLQTKIYKTSDPLLFDRAGIHPKEGNDEDSVILTVYKHKVFHRYPHTLSFSKMTEWIYHSHFPHLIRITNENFYSVFHGIKPAIILITQNEEFIPEFENIAAKYSLGLPYTEQLFSTLDSNEYNLFIPQLLPGLKSPLVTIFDPRKQLFYYKKINFQEDLEHQIFTLIKEYENNELLTYPYKINYLKYISYFLLGSLLLIILSILLKKEKKMID